MFSNPILKRTSSLERIMKGSPEGLGGLSKVSNAEAPPPCFSQYIHTQYKIYLTIKKIKITELDDL